uniref:Uncharacterized protein n=1 Tax=Trichuris muris TaxID=70415 RepID=A0A5S6Q066_TRIMR
MCPATQQLTEQRPQLRVELPSSVCAYARRNSKRRNPLLDEVPALVSAETSANVQASGHLEKRLTAVPSAMLGECLAPCKSMNDSGTAAKGEETLGFSGSSGKEDPETNKDFIGHNTER